ncbi:MAG: hypothetical protein LBI12_02065, partial [Treponema sp.]|nr:hypothetical protein [Treponema sp.]
MIFTLGNIITLCIVALALVLYRLADKNNRSMSNVRKYAEKCKDDIAVYVEEKSIAVKNFGINLDVEQKAAAKYLENIQKLTQEELAKKYESITRIEDHINAFESSLEELNGMTDRVQENLNLIRDESAFVENTGRRVSEAKERYEQLERAINNAARNLEETEERLERKNTESLEITANEVIKSAKSIVSDFETTAHVIERKIEEHKQAVTKSEREREAILSRDLELVKKTLKEVLENAGKRADKLEDAALVKLREQAVERVNNVKASFEEKIKAVQENLKTEQGTISEKLKEINTSQKNIQQEWTNELDKINSTIEKQMESWKLLCRDTEQNIIAENEKRLEEYNKIQTEAVRQLNSLADDSGHLEKELRQSMQDAISRVKGDFSSFEKETGASMQTAASTFNAQAETFRQELEDMDKQLDGIRQQAYDNVSEKLTAFENDFTSELGKRTSEFGRQISNWQAGLQEKIEISGERINKDLQQAEERIVIEQRKNIAVL